MSKLWLAWKKCGALVLVGSAGAVCPVVSIAAEEGNASVCQVSEAQENQVFIAGHRIVRSLSWSAEQPVRRDISDQTQESRRNLLLFAKAIELLRRAPETENLIVGEADKRNGIIQHPLNLQAYEAIVAKHGWPGAALLLPGLNLAAPSSKVCRDLSSEDHCVAIPKTLWGECRHHERVDNIDSPLFLLWHRAYLKAFEFTANSVLRASLPTDSLPTNPFGIPYWDWVVSPSLPDAFRMDSFEFDISGQSTSIKSGVNPLYQVRGTFANEGKPVIKFIAGVNPIAKC